jgi:plastocyanin
MRRVAASLAVLVIVPFAYAVSSLAGPDKIAFPAKYRDGTLYTTVDRYDIKEFRELYGNPEAVAAMIVGQPLPSGSVLTLVQYKAQLDAAGTPIKGPDGHFVKGDIVGYAVMEKRTGWGAEYPPDLRNGEWEYALFDADLKRDDRASYAACFACHKPHERTDYVISQTKLVAARDAPAAAIVPPRGMPAAVVNIERFTFQPAKVSIDKSVPVLWTNADDSPHQITVTTGTVTRSAVLARGQRHSQSFPAPGVYEYQCALHPAMKGQISVR